MHKHICKSQSPGKDSEKNQKGKDSFQLILSHQYYSDTKTRKIHHKERNYGPIPQQNTSKLNPRTYKKDLKIWDLF